MFESPETDPITPPTMGGPTSDVVPGPETSSTSAVANHPALRGKTVDLDALQDELDAIREQVLSSLGAEDAAYIRRLLRVQRSLDMAGRVTLMAGVLPPAWFAGVGMLALAKILENMEIGHNVMHGQWDWMRDPEIHSTSWEWDNVCPSTQWKHSHNHVHHQWTNVRGKDDDIGYRVLRVDPRQPWNPTHLAQPFVFVGLAILFEYGISLHDNEGLSFAERHIDYEVAKPKLIETWEKIRKQAAKDYVLFPLLATPFGLPSVVSVATGAVAANIVRNVWSFVVIFCGHFPDGVSLFNEEDVADETRGGWYLRQILGSANFTGNRIIDLLSGNLDHQIEHHLFPDLPSHRYAEIGEQVQEICERHEIPYSTGSLLGQFGSVVRKIIRLALPGGE